MVLRFERKIEHTTGFCPPSQKERYSDDWFFPCNEIEETWYGSLSLYKLQIALWDEKEEEERRVYIEEEEERNSCVNLGVFTLLFFILFRFIKLCV